MLEYLQVMIFANLFAITSNPQHVEDVKELVLTLLEDEQLEASFPFCMQQSCRFPTVPIAHE